MIDEIKKLGKVYRTEEKEVWLEIKKENFIEAVKKMKELGVERISAIAGIDEGKNIEILYSFFHDIFITIKTSVKKEACTIPTITPYFPGADLFERELSEMFGVKILGRKTKKLFLPEDVDKPMRK